mgnify:FL=1
MESRIAIIGIIVEDINASTTVNEILHDYGTYILGRMGIPYHEKGVNIISIASDAPQDIINTLAGKLGKVEGFGAKTTYSKI